MPKSITKTFAEPTQIDKNTTGLLREHWLEDVAVGFRDNNFVLDRLIPEKPVNYDSAKFRVYSPKGYFKAAPKRGETAIPQQAALQYSEDTYTAEEFAMEGWVSDDSIRNSKDAGITPMTDETEFLSQKILLTNELLISAEIISAIKSAGALYYTNLTAGTNWLTGGATANILGNLSTGIKAVVRNTGLRPNLITMTTDVIEAVVNNSTVQDILKRMSSGVLTESVPIPRLRGMEILLADGLVNIGSYDTPTYRSVIYDLDTATPLKQVTIVSYANPASRLSLGKNFVSKPFKVFSGRGMEGGRRQATLVAVWKKFVPKVTNPGAAYLIGSTLG